METCNHIYLKNGGALIDSYQDMQGALYYQLILFGCRHRDRREAVAGDFDGFQKFYDYLFSEGFHVISPTEYQQQLKKYNLREA